ncbi:uncharacterized protein LOC101864191 [Aplysia californica]|uniref:Uncharacterized protein LOC101864191 n=1 Tax=Aplysia californica TaxID=6500 RepID=A0ABM1W3F8_APLCA|nr:uncharacterized protein LOC101864191 [Aplysia californica]XP_012945507.1 uncharacterized protein LOC101864191 [Aplysia californica]XP_035829201.1 uncharacterized protein LOC101864191 [Aplysia californica]XP_035829202.1 uncharacterized protein LOC101864191 [Aplysia californica]
MAEKKEGGGGLASKFKRKASKKAAPLSSASMSTASRPDPKLSPTPEARSATLPSGTDPGAMALHQSPSEGLFSRLRRRFRMGSKGKYDLKTYEASSPTKPRKLRRKSDEPFVTEEEKEEEILRGRSKHVNKAQSVKTPRRVRSEKEEVILIRKDKRVSVICKPENGVPEVIFSNVDNSDEDSSEVLTGGEEDPYATISSIKEENRRRVASMKAVSNGKVEDQIRDGCSPRPGSVDRSKMSLGQFPTSSNSDKNKKATIKEDYPYAKINSSKKKKAVSPQEQEVNMRPHVYAEEFNSHVRARMKSRLEPDYETLDDVNQRKSEIEQRNSSGPVGAQGGISNGRDTYVEDQDEQVCAVIDPDYESLEEVKHKVEETVASLQGNNIFVHPVATPQSGHAHSTDGQKARLSNHQPPPIPSDASDNDLDPAFADPYAVIGEVVSAAKSMVAVSGNLPSSSLDGHERRSSTRGTSPRSLSQASFVTPDQDRSSLTSPMSSSSMAPLAPSIDSSLPLELAAEGTPTSPEEEEEECLYDNPNIILRKHGVRPGSEFYSTYSSSRRAQTVSEPPLLKTPAEEELVEKLSLALAPPLPLRNYQKEEAHPCRSGCSSARHSWASQSSARNLDPSDPNHGKASDNNSLRRDGRRNLSPAFVRDYPKSAENTLMKAGRKKVSSSKSHEELSSAGGDSTQEVSKGTVNNNVNNRLSPSVVTSALIRSFHGCELAHTVAGTVEEEPGEGTLTERTDTVEDSKCLSACGSESEHDQEICDIITRESSGAESGSSTDNRLGTDKGDIVAFCEGLAYEILSQAVCTSSRQFKEDCNSMQGSNCRSTKQLDLVSLKPEHNATFHDTDCVSDSVVTESNDVALSQCGDTAVAADMSTLSLSAGNDSTKSEFIKIKSDEILSDSSGVDVVAVEVAADFDSVDKFIESCLSSDSDEEQGEAIDVQQPSSSSNDGMSELYKAQGARPKRPTKFFPPRPLPPVIQCGVPGPVIFHSDNDTDKCTWHMDDIIEHQKHILTLLMQILEDKSRTELWFLTEVEKVHLLRFCTEKFSSSTADFETIFGDGLFFREYVDSDSEDENDQDEGENNTHHGMQIKEYFLDDVSVRKIPITILFANHLLLEHALNRNVCQQPHMQFVRYRSFVDSGVFTWSRFHDIPEESRRVVEAKVRSFFHYCRKMMGYECENEQDRELMRLEQEIMDEQQQKIERRLRKVQDLPTFQDVMEEISTSLSSHIEPGRALISSPSSRSDDRHKVHICTPDPATPGAPDGKAAHSRKCPYGFKGRRSDRAENTCKRVPPTAPPRTADAETTYSESERHDSVAVSYQQKPHLSTLLAGVTSTSQAVQEFHRLCEHGLTTPASSPCVSQSLFVDEGTGAAVTPPPTDYDSDSEDEMITLDTYARIMTRPLQRRRSETSTRDDTVFAIYSYTPFSGELAYAVRRRPPRRKVKAVVVRGPREVCLGVGSHVTLAVWTQMDQLMKKLVPHISPRLDFRFLLKIYEQFKQIVLVPRKKNYSVKGCYQIERSCTRFLEFVFLKLIRDELRVFSHVMRKSKMAKALATEEKEISLSLVSLLSVVLENLGKMKRTLHREHVNGFKGVNEPVNPPDPFADHPIVFRHPSYRDWQSDRETYRPPLEPSEMAHACSDDAFFLPYVSKTLSTWMSPEHLGSADPNVLLGGTQVMAARVSSGPVEVFGNFRKEPKPLQEREDFLESMQQLQLKEWYWGPISYEQAALILQDREDGSFLVRDSSDRKYLLSLSFKSLGEVHHTRIEHAKGLFSFWSQPESHGKARICEFIEKSVQNSRDGRFLYFLRPSSQGTPPLPIKLLVPVSRNFRVASLKHLSRFVVRQTVRNDHIDLLPVPEKVKRYLLNKQYYVEILACDHWAFDSY